MAVCNTTRSIHTAIDQLDMSGFCGVIHQIVILLPKSIKSELKVLVHTLKILSGTVYEHV